MSNTVMMMKETKQIVTERIYESTSAKELNQVLKQVMSEGFACGAVQVGYQTGDESSRVYWFKATKKEPIA